MWHIHTCEIRAIISRDSNSYKKQSLALIHSLQIDGGCVVQDVKERIASRNVYKKKKMLFNVEGAPYLKKGRETTRKRPHFIWSLSPWLLRCHNSVDSPSNLNPNGPIFKFLMEFCRLLAPVVERKVGRVWKSFHTHLPFLSLLSLVHPSREMSLLQGPRYQQRMYEEEGFAQ